MAGNISTRSDRWKRGCVAHKISNKRWVPESLTGVNMVLREVDGVRWAAQCGIL